MRCLASQPRFLAVILIIVIAAPAELLSQVARTAHSESVLFALTISGAKSSVKAGSAVWVRAILENKSDHDLSVYKAISDDMDQGGWVYQVDIRDGKGEEPRQTEFARSVGAGGSGGYIPLPPGKALTDRVNVSKLYDLSRPGRYTIQFQRVDMESKTFVTSNKITVTVVP